MNILIYFLFALSGFAGLIYEGSWARYLKLFLGHSSYGQVLTLCIYMGGLAIGSFVAGKLVTKTKRPLLGYGLVELAIGIGGVAYHPLYNLLTGIFFTSEFTAGLSSRGAEIVKVLLATGSTLPIAIAVGMTFPFIAAGLMRKSGAEVSLPMLYFTNSLGSAIGILATSYLLIPNVGNHATLCVAAGINFLLAAIFSFIGLTTSPVHTAESEDEEDPNEDYVAKHNLPMPHKNTWLWIAAITGLTSFVYEIVWTRLLSLLMGSSSHSFDQMLSAFILGLALGSACSGKLLKKDSLIVLSLAQIFMAFFALCTLYFHQPFWAMMNEANQIFNPTTDGYVCWSLFKYALSLLWMVPTSFFAGMTLPLITLILTRAFKSEAPIGKVYGWNTLGSIIGSAGGGLLLLPLLQLKGALVLAAILDFAIGFILIAVYRKRWRRSVMFYVVAAMMVLPAIFVKFDPSLITSGAFRAYKNLHPDEKIRVIDGKTATISFHESPVHFYVKTNGKADASMSKDREAPISSDELTQAATAFMPMAVMDKPYDAAMVGFGSGMGAHYLLSDPLLKDFDCVEIEEAMMDLAKGFYPWNNRGYDDPRIHIFIDDATTFFHTNRRQYDMIISVPSNPWVSGVAGLFADEFYAKMRRYMKPGGLWVQWIQTYEFNDLMFLNILKAMDKNFPYVSLYKSTDEPDIIMIASDQPVFQKGIGRFSTDTALVNEFNRIHREPEFFGERNFLFTNKMVSALLDGVEPNSVFVPMVDNRAEEARFTHSEAHIVQMFDSCEVCWQQYLDPKDNEPRRAARVDAMLKQGADPFVARGLLNYAEYLLKESEKISQDGSARVPENVVADSAKADSAVVAGTDSADTTGEVESAYLQELEKSAEFQKFRDEYVEWIRRIPLEARDTNTVYMKVRELVQKNRLPASFRDEFNIMEAARAKDYAQAAIHIAKFYDSYEMRAMDELFLRNCIVLSLLANEPELTMAVYKDAIEGNESFFGVERRLIKRELQKLRSL
ncbi:MULTISPECIES: spermidine synthase [unclassified Fibrobacter]|uniref:spermine/spermidine synthase domain-containing protein n=1 Tax=unclassified Fibrobacter TaxID=2634177 RepID=UPI000D6CEC0D|nr:MULTISPECIES: spermidine synthase [unclassified Fibrobacter]PWJ64908.1 putative membrane-bound spermidine synthase [Fibrobacter sp. UWR4]PZW68973.1 putative membrane-bound spermidine synthase [Fibrobacter sp. UWR1]